MDAYSEKRKSHRHGKTVILEYTINEEKASILHYGLTVNISDQGICFFSGHNFSVNQNVSFTTAKKYSSGSVKWQRELQGNLYKVGLDCPR